MSLAGQWDTVNGKVLRCLAVQALMDHDFQLERDSISDVMPVGQWVHSRLFRVDPDTGRLVTRQPLDRDEKAFHRAVAIARPPGNIDEASDTASGRSNVDIVVADRK